LLVLARENGERRHLTFRDLPELLVPGDLLIMNRSRVFPARLLGTRSGGGEAEVFLIRPLPDGSWEALLRPARRLRPGDVVTLGDGSGVRIESGPVAWDGRRRVRLLAEPSGADDAQADWQTIDKLGHVPLPPYIRRADGAHDRQRYQTVFARERGSVAAPTAGLHFTHELLDRLHERGIATTEIVLHVGPGTFAPVQCEEVEDHKVAPEAFEIPEEAAAAIRGARERGGRVIAVGTTATRALESRAHADRTVSPGAGETDLVILPGHHFTIVDGLITNFHLPRSSLLLLVSAFAGRERVLAAYREAIALGYRFYSYGDAMLIC
jgi:S-adenosylmethionine:tRNA ribosyltransferase-isomerase